MYKVSNKTTKGPRGEIVLVTVFSKMKNEERK